MARVLSTVVVLALLAATAVAFAITEGAKLQLSPIASTFVSPVFSPDSKDPATQVAHVRFRLRTAEKLEAWIRDSHGHKIAVLQPSRTFHKGAKLDLIWDGILDDGIAAPDGDYSPVVKLERSHRTIGLPNVIVLDTKPPVITVPKPEYPIISPDGDHHHDTFRVHYRINGHAHAILFVNDRRVEFTHDEKPTGVLVWYGTVDGKPARPGRYTLTVAAQDLAGNRSKPYPFAIVQVRYLVLARSRVTAAPGATFALRVSTDAPSVQWTLHGRSGVERSGTLHFRAPKTKAVYHLYVTAAGHAAQCTVVVR